MTNDASEWYSKLTGQAHGYIFLVTYLESWLKSDVSQDGMGRDEVVALVARAHRIVDLDSRQLRLFVPPEIS